MYAVLKSIGTVEDVDLESWRPTSNAWSLLIHFTAGLADHAGGDDFSLTVCSPAQLARDAATDGIFDARAHLVMNEFSFREVHSYIDRRVRTTSGATWREIAVKLSRFAAWEFEDYRLR